MKFKKLLSLSLAGIITVSGFGCISLAETPKTDFDYIREVVTSSIKYGEGYSSIVVVNERSLNSDGLCSSSLIGASNGVLATINESVQSAEDIDSLIKESGNTIKTVYILGGEQAISSNFEYSMEGLGYNCIRIEGRDRIETSFKIADEVKKLTNVKEYAVARGYKGDADAVNIAYQSKIRKMPVLLSKDGKTLNYNTESKKVYAIGGTAVLSDSLVKNLKATRVAGSDRFRTNEAVFNYFKTGKELEPIIVSGDNDRLGIAVLASNQTDSGQPLLISEWGYKGNIINKDFSGTCIPLTRKSDIYLQNLAYGYQFPEAIKYEDPIIKKLKLNKYDFNLAVVLDYQVGDVCPGSKHIKDFAKNYHVYLLYETTLNNGGGYWTETEPYKIKDRVYLANKKTGKLYKYNSKTDSLVLLK